MSVGIRELKDHLSQHIAQVRDGVSITITDHGKPVARLVPISPQSPFEQLLAAGLITPPSTGKRVTPQPIRAKGTVSDLIAEQRG
ncbi:type II toxin-antitoxin system Phd/YefM family antitoxin [Pseudarthrobacter sp. N5]|uniref:type II toxin-antitoxin system Phd/YefM family antitoxin n=1 Tax=Pseudarthrobacter sp. N5 TaxID=3418416 RepID=UPI003CE8E673